MTAAVARVNSFDLLGPEGWEMLTQDVATDFPYLSLADINATMALGRKGALDVGRAQPLNYTRIYKWVKHRAPFSLGYWKALHPALTEWADMLGVAAEVLAEIETYETPAAAFAQPHKFRGLLQKVVRSRFYPSYETQRHYKGGREAYPTEAGNYDWIEQQLYPEFLAKHPELATEHTPIF